MVAIRIQVEISGELAEFYNRLRNEAHAQPRMVVAEALSLLRWAFDCAQDNLKIGSFTDEQAKQAKIVPNICCPILELLSVKKKHDSGLDPKDEERPQASGEGTGGENV